MESSSLDEIDPEIIKIVQEHMDTNKQITDEKWRARLPEIVRAYRALKAQANCPADIPIPQAIGANTPNWRIKVIACNESVSKSLHPKVELNVGGHQVEMNAEKLSELRYTIAQLLHRMQHYN